MRFHNIELLLLTLHTFITGAKAEKCAAAALKLPYRNISLTPGVLTHGIPVSIGTPWQHIAFMPSLQIDNTLIPRYTNTCISKTSPSTPTNSTRRSLPLFGRDARVGSFQENLDTNAFFKCAEVYGGAFQPALSTSSHDNRTNNQVDEWWFNKTQYSDWHFITELFTFTDYLDVYSLTHEALPEKRNITANSLIVPDEGAEFGGVGSALLGLAPNSTLLKALHHEKVIPSTSWSLTNASLCFGCEDVNAHTGDFYTFKPADRDAKGSLPCLFQVKIEALNWHPNPNREGASLINETFTTCIDPGVKFLVLPDGARKSFNEIISRDVESEFDDYTVFKGPAKDETGILTVKIKSGPEVNITILRAGKAGAEERGEWRVPIGKGGWGAYGEGIPILGKPFAEQVVMKWDSKAGEFGIVNANKDPNRQEDIKPLGCDDFPTIEKSVEKTPGTGTIVGSVVGGFIGGLVFAAAGLWFFKRGEKGVRMKYQRMDEDEDALAMGYISRAGNRNTADSMMSGALSPPAPSVKESIRSQVHGRPGSPMLEPQLVDDTALYEAPEGGTAVPTKRERTELNVPGYGR